jgi:proline racemase
MHGAMLTEPTSPTAHAGVLSMHGAGFPLVSGEGLIGAVTIALEHKFIEGVEDEVIIDTPVGLFRARPRIGAAGARGASGAVSSVAVTGVPSFVESAGLVLKIGTRQITVDIAFGGQFYAIADSEAIGIPIDIANADALVRVGRQITDAIESDIHGTIFTGASRTVADLRSATVLDGEILRRSPGMTGTAALMSVLDAMGLLTDDRGFTHEGVLGTTLQGSVASRRQMGERRAVIPVIEGSATITGFHEFVSG